jgi:hypothetical protein
MSDHLDAPALKSPNMDARVAITGRRKDLPKKITYEEPTSSSTETVPKRHLIA